MNPREMIQRLLRELKAVCPDCKTPRQSGTRNGYMCPRHQHVAVDAYELLREQLPPVGRRGSHFKLQHNVEDAGTGDPHKMRFCPDEHGGVIEVDDVAFSVVADVCNGELRLYRTNEQGEVVDGPALSITLTKNDVDPT